MRLAFRSVVVVDLVNLDRSIDSMHENPAGEEANGTLKSAVSKMSAGFIEKENPLTCQDEE